MRAEFVGPSLAGDLAAAIAPSIDVAPGRPDILHHVRWSRRQWLVALAILAGFWAVTASMWPLTGSVVPWDSKNHFYPMLRYLGAALANGELPLWNPYHFSGYPAVADPQSLLFTPTMVLFGWLVPKPSMTLFDIVVLAHLLPGAVAILALFNRRGWRSEGGLVAAFVFILGGSASARLQHTGIVFGYGYYPLALFLLEEALDRRSYRFSALFAVVASLMVLGRDQVAFLSGLSLVALVGHRVATAPRPLAFLRSRLGLLLFACLLGALILVVPVVLTMQFLMTSTRPSFGYGVAAMGSLPPESFATILFANVFGSLRHTYDYWGPDWHSLIEGTWTDRATNYLFVGTLPALLILWHGLAGGRLFAREFRFFLVLGAVSVIYALGRYTPLFSVIFDSLPGVALYRRPADATFLINIVLAFGSGYLVHRYVVEGAPRLVAPGRSPIEIAGAASRSAAAIALVLAAIVCGFSFAAFGHHRQDAVQDMGFAFALAAALAWLLMSGNRNRRQMVAAALVAFTGAELIWRNAASALNAEPAERYAVFKHLPPEQLRGLQILRHAIAQDKSKGEHPRVEILGLGGAWQNASMVLDLEDTIGYNPLRLADYERAVGPGENAADPNLREFPGTFRGYRCRLAGLLGLEYLVLDRPIQSLPRHFPRVTGAKLLYGSGAMWIYHLAPGAPRAYLATRLLPVDSETVLAQGEMPEFDRKTAALVEKDQMNELTGTFGAPDEAAGAGGPAGTVSITAYRRNEVSLSVDTDRHALVVLHDIYYPGWQVFVDGQRQDIVRTNLLFRGVEVGPGHHDVVFRFRPLSIHNLVAAAEAVVDGTGSDAASADAP